MMGAYSFPVRESGPLGNLSEDGEDRDLLVCIKTTYPFHIVDPSPWPLVAAGAFEFTFGTVMFMNK
jgi:hypothetical protein